MPRQNRVDPFGSLCAVSQRGTWMGNRGCLHDESGRVRRQYRGKRWIICELDFRDRRRPVMAAGRYTELFFLDEATALAAGHRPCWECRRNAAEEFLALSPYKTLTELDQQLHTERLAVQMHEEDWRILPDGTMVSHLDSAFLVQDQRLWHWSFEGYAPAVLAPDAAVRLLTPPTSVAIIRGGYSVQTRTDRS